MSRRNYIRKYSGDIDADDEDIRSHSSLLTNKTVNELFREMLLQNFSTYSDPSYDNILRFFGIVRSIYLITFPLFSDSENEAISNARNDATKKIHEISVFINENSDDDEEVVINQETLYNTLFSIEKMAARIIASLQIGRHYFFRVGEKDIRSMEKSLEIFENKGGVLSATK